jgi:hypothetical protein
MRITSRQLRQIIREELIREAGFGDLKVAERQEDRKIAYDILTRAWYDALDADLEPGPDGDGEGSRIIANAQVRDTSSLLLNVSPHPDFSAMKPKLLANFDKAFSSFKGKISDNLLNIEIRGEYAKWVDHATWLASLLFVDSFGARDPRTDEWRGIDTTVMWLGQEIKRRGINLNMSEDAAREGLANLFLRGTEELTGAVKRSLASGMP